MNKLLGWLGLGAGIFLIDSAVHNRTPLATLKLVLSTGKVPSQLVTTQINPTAAS